MGIYAPSKETFRSLLQVSRCSIANPLWFASPVDAREDDDFVTIVFHVPVKSHGRVRVQASDQSVTVLGRSRAMRLCALPNEIDKNAIEVSRAEDLLNVRIPKKRAAMFSKGMSSVTPST
ncbi:MAG TPA: Hsp20/alpha crystallin family protein [Polyangiaceae bacterium]|nr:Hsp20/alpha crystallin family protein [Polyangiaceae bacterium]